MKIITLTLNPAFDVHCQTDSFELYQESLADITETRLSFRGFKTTDKLIDQLEEKILSELDDTYIYCFCRKCSEWYN